MLITLDELKDGLGITGADDDAYLTAEIGRQSAAVADWCGLEPNQRGLRGFEQETATISFAADEGRHHREPLPLVLPWRIPVAVTKVTVAGVDLADTAYEAEPMAALLHRLDTDGRRIHWERGRIVVAITTGWLLEEMPQALRSAVLGLVSRAYWSRGRDPALRSERILDVLDQSWTTTDGSELENGLPADIAQLLAPYRSPK